MSDAQFPCPICHLAFKTEAKVSQHVEKCLASQEREERSSRSRNSNNNNNKRRADDDDEDDADVTSLTRNDSKRSRKEDQVAAWSGLGLQSPSSADTADKPLKGKSKKSSSSGKGAASLAVKIPPAKKSVTNGKKNSEKKIGKEKSETGGNFGKEI